MLEGICAGLVKKRRCRVVEPYICVNDLIINVPVTETCISFTILGYPREVGTTNYQHHWLCGGYSRIAIYYLFYFIYFLNIDTILY